MLATVEKGPSKLTWVLLVVVEGSGLGAEETDWLTIVTDGAHTVSRVDLEAGKVTQFGTHLVRFLKKSTHKSNWQ